MYVVFAKRKELLCKLKGTNEFMQLCMCPTFHCLCIHMWSIGIVAEVLSYFILVHFSVCLPVHSSFNIGTFRSQNSEGSASNLVLTYYRPIAREQLRSLWPTLLACWANIPLLNYNHIENGYIPLIIYSTYMYIGRNSPLAPCFGHFNNNLALYLKVTEVKI